MKKTVLYEKHLENNGKMVEYANYMLPVEYTGLISEHLAVRNSWGMFDCSHMGEILITGPASTSFIMDMITSSIGETMRMYYGLLLYEDGGVIDDLMCYHFNSDKNLLVVNASNKDKDLEWLNLHSKGYDIEIVDLSNDLGLLAIQGPLAVTKLKEIANFPIEEMRLFDFVEGKLDGVSYIISRSGYTGEDGFEVYGTNKHILTLFDKLKEMGVSLCGLGCRDTLRFEANLPLYGHEISEDINPYEAGLGYAIDLNKNFIGRDSLRKIKLEGIKRKIVGLEIEDRRIARSGYDVFCEGKKIGYVTTGYMIPGTKEILALALVDKEYSNIGREVEVLVHKNLVKAVIRDRKFLNKKYVK